MSARGPYETGCLSLEGRRRPAVPDGLIPLEEVVAIQRPRLSGLRASACRDPALRLPLEWAMQLSIAGLSSFGFGPKASALVGTASAMVAASAATIRLSIFPPLILR